MQEVRMESGDLHRQAFEENQEIQRKFEQMRQGLEQLNGDSVKEYKTTRRIKSNDRCPCDSGKKFKRCCMKKVK